MAMHPAFTALVVATLALGVGLGTTVFAVVNATLLRPSPFGDGPTVVSLTTGRPSSRGELAFVRIQGTAFEAVGGFLTGTFIVEGGAERPGAYVSPAVLEWLRDGASVGRLFAEADERPGSAPVVILSSRLWRQVFGGDPAIVGRTLAIDGVSRTVVGVLAPGQDFTPGGVDLYLPLELNPRDEDFWTVRELTMMARLHPGAGVADARAGIADVVERLQKLYPTFYPPDASPDAGPAELLFAGGSAISLWVLFGAALLVLVVACANAGNLLLSRALVRQQEFAVRAAIGASRARLVWLQIVESLLFGLTGGAVGVAVAVWGARVLASLLPIGRVADGRMLEPRVLAFAVLASAASAVVAGLLPISDVVRRTLARDLGDGRRTSGRRQRRVQRVLVAGQIGLAVMLVTGSGLLVATLANFERVNPGFTAASVVVARVSPPETVVSNPSLVAFYDRVAAGARGLAGVTGVGFVNALPLDATPSAVPINLRERPVLVAQARMADRRVVGDDYFEALGIPVVAGRVFDGRDARDGVPVAVINETMARRFWPGEDPIGRDIAVDPHMWTWWIRVVGVVGDVRSVGLSDPVPAEFYLPRAQAPARDMTMVVRASAGPGALAPVLAAAVDEAGGTLATGAVRPLQDIVRASYATPRTAAFFFGAFAMLALGMGVLGVYGVQSTFVASRTREIAIRLAVGAEPRAVGRLFLRDGVALGLAGAVAGLMASLAAARALTTMLFGVGPADPLTLAGASALLVAVSALATWLPARRASRVDPVTALRAE